MKIDVTPKINAATFKPLKTRTRYIQASISPELAAKMLEFNTLNRSMKEGQVDKLVRAMKNGDFIYNPADSILFEKGGTLVSGQHRLMAVVKSGVTVEMDVVMGEPAHTRYIIDLTNGRTTAEIRGFKTGNHKTAGQRTKHVRNINNLMTPGRVQILSPQESEALEEEFPVGLVIVDEEFGSLRRGLGRGPIAAAFVIAAQAHPKQTRELIKQLVGGQVSETAQALYRYIFQGESINKDDKTTISKKVLYGIFHHITGNQVERLRNSDTEAAVFAKLINGPLCQKFLAQREQ